MLVPTLVQNTRIRQEVSNNPETSLKPYFLNSILLVVFMLILIPFSLFVFKDIYFLPNYIDYFYTLIKLFPCYIIFVFDSVVEAYFFSTGKLHHILIQNIITNIGVYLTAFVLIVNNVLTISLNLVIIIFNLGVIVSSLYTIMVYIIMKKRRNKHII